MGNCFIRISDCSIKVFRFLLGLGRGVGNDWNFVGHFWNYFWKMKYGLKILLFHPYFERWKLDINKCNDRLRECNDRLRKLTETSLILKKIYLNYEILRTEFWNMSHEIFQKVEIWALIFLSLKFRRRFSIVSYLPLGLGGLSLPTTPQHKESACWTTT